MSTTADRVWTDDEIRKMWPQSAGELRGFQAHLEATRSGITANEIGMALQLAEVTFKKMTDPSEANKGQETSPSVEILDKIEAFFDYFITCVNKRYDVSDTMVFTPRIDGFWSALKNAREKAGRPTPKL